MLPSPLKNETKEFIEKSSQMIENYKTIGWNGLSRLVTTWLPRELSERRTAIEEWRNTYEALIILNEGLKRSYQILWREFKTQFAAFWLQGEESCIQYECYVIW